MSLLRESCLYRLWLAFWASYLDSSLSRLIRRVENWCGRQVETSFLLQPLCREDVVARGWPDSLLCRLLNVIIDLPARILRWLYGLLQPALKIVFLRGWPSPSGILPPPLCPG